LSYQEIIISLNLMRLIVNPFNFSEDKKSEIKNAFQPVYSQTIQSIDRETKSQNRRSIDELIFRSIGLDTRYIEKVYFELNRMVSNRLCRANTF